MVARTNQNLRCAQLVRYRKKIGWQVATVLIRPQQRGNHKNCVHLIAAIHRLDMPLNGWKCRDEDHRSDDKHRTKNEEPSFHGVRSGLTSEVRRQPLEAVHRRSPDRETATRQITAQGSGCCLHRFVMRNLADTVVLETPISHSFTQSQPTPKNKAKAHTTQRPGLDKPTATQSKTTARNPDSHFRRKDISTASGLQRHKQTLMHNVRGQATATGSWAQTKPGS